MSYRETYGIQRKLENGTFSVFSLDTELTLIMQYMKLRVLYGYHGIRYYCQQDLGEYGPNSTVQLVLNLDYTGVYAISIASV